MPICPDDEIGAAKRSLEDLLGLLEMLPEPVRNKVESEIRQLLAIIQEARFPRVMVFGRRGSGKSTLVNAIFGAKVREVGAVSAQTGTAEWSMCDFAGHKMEILDTRGVQEGSRPIEQDDAASSIESLLTEVRKKCPDLILFTVKAKEVDTAIRGDLVALQQIRCEARRTHNFSPMIIPIVTQCDELDPVYVQLPTDHLEKIAHIERAVAVLTRHVLGKGDLAEGVLTNAIPIVALQYFDDEDRPMRDRDYRWNIDTLALVMQEHLPDETQLAFTRLAKFRVVQRKFAQRVVNLFSTINGAVGAQPIPLADMPIITALQTSMILVVSYISGNSISAAAIRDFFVGLGVNIGAGMTFREVARALLKALPFLGNAASGGIAFAGTRLIGNAAIAYYIDRRSIAEIRSELQSFWKRFVA